MARLFVRHDVADYAAWRKVYDAFHASGTPKRLGVTAEAVYRTAGKPDEVTAWHDFATEEQAEAFVASAELREAMRNAGVVGAPLVWIALPA